jgi:hypothetical protein
VSVGVVVGAGLQCVEVRQLAGGEVRQQAHVRASTWDRSAA